MDTMTSKGTRRPRRSSDMAPCECLDAEVSIARFTHRSRLAGQRAIAPNSTAVARVHGDIVERICQTLRAPHGAQLKRGPGGSRRRSRTPLRSYCQLIRAFRRGLRQAMKASAPLAPFSSAGVERTGLNMFGTFCRVSAVLVCGDHGEPGAQVSQMVRWAKSANNRAFTRRQSAASYRKQVA
jgi:hypothetical protein